jgi:transposase
LTEADYARLLDAAHRRLGGPIVLAWDNLNTHVSAAMTETIAARPRRTVIRLPAYAHELNPVEPVWAHLKPLLAYQTKAHHRRANGAGEDTAQADVVPPRAADRLPRQYRARVRIIPVTSALEDR